MQKKNRGSGAFTLYSIHIAPYTISCVGSGSEALEYSIREVSFVFKVHFAEPQGHERF